MRSGVDLAGLVGNYYFKVECSDVDIGVLDTNFAIVEVDDIFKMWIDDVVVLSGGYGSETWVNLTRGFYQV